MKGIRIPMKSKECIPGTLFETESMDQVYISRYGKHPLFFLKHPTSCMRKFKSRVDEKGVKENYDTMNT